METMRMACLLMAAWMSVELLTVMAAAVGVGPFTALVANDLGEADAHTRRFAAFLTSSIMLNGYAILTTQCGCTVKNNLPETTRRQTVMHTVMVSNMFSMSLALIVEWTHYDAICVAWHIGLCLGFGSLLFAGDWTTSRTNVQ